MKKIMILGAGSCQLNVIKRVKELGYKALVTGYNEVAVGKNIADISLMADTFSFEENLKCAKDYNIDGILTVGTDQPVLIVNKVAKSMNLPKFLNPEIALNVTNKKNMKEKFVENNIPTVDYRFIKKNFLIEELEKLKSPYVMKPLDSQGQRGIFFVNSISEVRNKIDETLKYSRTDEILVESYYENKELTVTGWVNNSEVKILTVTDRVTFQTEDQIGVCVSHEYPSIHLEKYREKIFDITKKICYIFNIKEGPIYFQFLVGDRGILVNEIACRIGGAYEDISVPFVTGVDILNMNIEGSIKSEYDKTDLEAYIYSDDKIYFSTQLFFCNSGFIASMTSPSEILKKEYILDFGYNFNEGEFIPETENASQRVGFVIITGKSEEDLKRNIEKTYNVFEILDQNGNNLVIKGERGYRD